MPLKRGDIIRVRQPKTPAAKARPYIIIQRDDTLADATKITGCPLTSHLRGTNGVRPQVMPTPENRLRALSEVEMDWIYTHPIEMVGGLIGRVDEGTMESIDEALRRWLDL